MKPASYTVFLAFPYDAATGPMYRDIADELTKRYSGRFRFLVGIREVIPPSPRDLTIRTFKSQNNDLLKQFRDNVRASDIIVADLTNNNPNVHVELGIALTLNKNVLRVSSRNPAEVASDVKGNEVSTYRDKAALTNRLDEYLTTFLEIKDLPFSQDAGAFYEQDHTPTELSKGQAKTVGAMRDGGVRVRFSFTEASPDEWFGIYFRSGSPSLFTGGYLLYVRQNGSIELAEFPRGRILATAQRAPLELNQDYVLELCVDGNVMSAVFDGRPAFEFGRLSIQSYGTVSVGCWKCEVRVTAVETVCRDAIEFAE